MGAVKRKIKKKTNSPSKDGWIDTGYGSKGSDPMLDPYMIKVKEELLSSNGRKVCRGLACGDRALGAYLNGILMWAIPDDNGKTKMRVNLAGRLCTVKHDDEAVLQFDMTKEEVSTRKKKSVEQGWIEVKVRKFGGIPKTHVLVSKKLLDVFMTYSKWVKGKPLANSRAGMKKDLQRIIGICEKSNWEHDRGGKG